MSTPPRTALICGFALTPPKIVVLRKDNAFASGAIAASIWLASSLVGARISARGLDARRFTGRSASRASSGSTNA